MSSSAQYFQRTHANTPQDGGVVRNIATRVGPGHPLALVIRCSRAGASLWELRFDDVRVLRHAVGMSHRASTRTPLEQRDGIRYAAGPGVVWIVSHDHGEIELRGDELAGLERALAEIARIRGAA